MSDTSSIKVTNPFTAEVVAHYQMHTQAQVAHKLDAAEAAFPSWSAVAVEERARLVGRMAGVFMDRKDELARIAVEEMGKPLSQAIAEIEKCARACTYCAQEGPTFLEDHPLPSDTAERYVRYLPLGIILAVMPWNFPFWQAVRFMAPNLVAGNVGLLKHASLVPGCALALEEITHAAGLPDGVFQTLLISSDTVSGLVEDPRIKAVTVTGSNKAGEAVAGKAGAQAKKTVLELGGSDPFIVMPSADLEKAVDAAVAARLQNNGQSCIAAKRFIIHDTIYDRFAAAMKEKLSAIPMGDPMEEDTRLGPLASRDALQGLQTQVDESVKAGASLWQADLPDPGNGFFHPPAILEDIPRQSPAYLEEIFGPVALLFRARDREHALHLANDTQYGLGSAVFTEEEEEKSFFINHLEAGMTFINQMVASDPGLPFGGIKASGHGRELSLPGFREFVNAKTVSVA